MSGEDYSQCQTNQFHDVAINDWFLLVCRMGNRAGTCKWGKLKMSFSPCYHQQGRKWLLFVIDLSCIFKSTAKRFEVLWILLMPPHHRILGTGFCKNAFQAAGIINGKDDNLFDPRGYATEQRAATMLSNLSAYMMAMPH